MVNPGTFSFSFITPARVHTLLCTTFLLGIFVFIALAAAALIGTLLIVKQLLMVCLQVAVLVSQLYSTGGPVVQLCLWIVALILFCKASPYIALVVRRAVKQLL